MKKIAWLMIILGLIFRLIYPLEVVFHFDQEQIAEAAIKIINGKLTLIGPIANTISFFTGPLIYYFAAFFYWVTKGHPLANILISSSIYLITILSCWWLLRRFTNLKTALIFIIIYSLSPHLIILDRVTWDPDFSFLSACLVLIGFLFPHRKISYLTVFIGMWLAYQAHFAGFVLVAEAVIIGVWLKRFRLIAVALAGFALSLLTTLIFDLRHEWLNSLGLWRLISSSEKLSGDFLIYRRLIHSIFISLENISKLIVQTSSKWNLVALGVIIFFFWLKNKSNIFQKRQKYILLIWSLTFPLVVMFYKGATPEYYYLMQLPALVFILTDIIYGLRQRKEFLTLLILGLFTISLGGMTQDIKAMKSGASLNNKLQALRFIKKHPGELVFDMEVKDRFGWRYLINYLNITPAQSPIKAHLIYPINPGAIISAKFGGVGVWIDNRGSIEAYDYVDGQKGLLFYYPYGYFQIGRAERILFPDDQTIKVEAFVPQNLSGQKALDSGIYYIHLPKNEKNKYFSVRKTGNIPGSLDRWEEVSFLVPKLQSRKSLARERKEDLFIFSFPVDYNWETIELFLSQVEGI